MEEEKKKEKLFSTKAYFQYFSSEVDKIAEGEALIVINTEELIISLQFKEPFIIKFIDIIEINPIDYKVYLPLSPSGKLIINQLGYEFENFIRILKDARNEIFAKYLLMEEKVIRKNIKAEFKYFENGDSVSSSGNCNITIYETGISILPENGKLIRIAYCEITDIAEGDYLIKISTDDEKILELSKLGYEFESFKKILHDTINTLDIFAQNLVMELDPSLDTINVRLVAKLLRDGKAAMKKDIEKYSSQVWKSLEKKIEKAGILQEYNYLKSISRENQIAIGLKQGLMGDLTCDYIWFLIPIYSNDPKKPGNAIAMEAVPIESDINAEEKSKENNSKSIHGNGDNSINHMSNTPDITNVTKEVEDLQKNMIKSLNLQNDVLKNVSKFSAISENSNKNTDTISKAVSTGEAIKNEDERNTSETESTGKATYFFKIMSRADYLNPENLLKAEPEIDKLIKKINKAMISINFRREPVYIDENALYDPKNIKYRFAISRIAELRELRERFIGRVIHLNFDYWKNKIQELLKFNVETIDEKTKFKKSKN
ncbi:MAG: hypothetical protein M1475_05635 [Actinobacteria bacterium]|nr:hypothetical protein [Cyanobacteriota bacterium]MCL6087874.1 hypothetical protein [Actinomycetota bacterium]